MIFSSASFFVFFAAVLLLYAAAGTVRQRAALLLAASLIFYASWKPIYLLLLGASLSVNYVLYNLLLRKRSLPVLATGIALNLAVLGACKYLGFALESALWIASRTGWAGDSRIPEWVNWALPLGISFYTFHMLSALIDLYRGHWAKPVTFARWCLYVTFFPHLIAGPILRPGQLIDQLGELRPVELASLRVGAAIFLAGLLKKVMFADNLAPIVDKLYAHPASLDFGAAWTATLAFAFQIYFDFSGYSEMAIGLAAVFGVTLPRNFLYPYVSRSPREFWRRWHITLSLWLRDYLYIPLGGSRGTEARTQLNLFITMLLGGLWHGASWTFAVWGALHGSLLIAQRLLEGLSTRLRISGTAGLARVNALVGLPLTFLIICFTWVFFRAPGFEQAWRICAAMLGLAEPQGGVPSIRFYEAMIVAAAAIVVFLEPVLFKVAASRGIGWWWSLPFPLRGTCYAALVLVLIVFGGPTQKFIYFDF
jgi:D-alanyl-lipoteichoic acid acyltransferase DltB (MBOAT superfamily)